MALHPARGRGESVQFVSWIGAAVQRLRSAFSLERGAAAYGNVAPEYWPSGKALEPVSKLLQGAT
jgi:hypothetical protein